MIKQNDGGFSLVELLIIIVLIAIILPNILMPFINAAKGVAVPSDIARLTYIARGNMDMVLAETNAKMAGTWPNNGAGTNDYTKTVAPETLDSRTYTTTVTGQFVDAVFANDDVNDNYLIINVTTTDNNGNSITLETLKSSALNK